ncbi:hypothetical protein KKG31_07555 [Patescibacteria group bacterium]|nr:hypothetical protein [Nanoarchaeota archaeon]MBU1758924.1 hypothetical protein [Patescibacteria group bacterium]
MKKIGVLLMFLLVLALFVVAEDVPVLDPASEDTCSGFFSWFKCLLFGDSSKRAVAGSAWWEND